MATALVAYRHLLRSTRLAFAGDAPLLRAARTEARNSFRSNLSISGPEQVAAVKHAEEVAQILKANVVQGRKVDSEADGDRYKLRIHEHTERGDNDTVKMPNGQKVVIDGKTCGS